MKKININFQFHPNSIAVCLPDGTLEYYNKLTIKGDSSVVVAESGRRAWIEVADEVEIEGIALK